MANIRINRAGIRALLTEPGVRADLSRRARRIAAAAGPGHRVEDRVGRTRARSSVVTDTFEAMEREALDRNLTRAVDAGRG